MPLLGLIILNWTPKKDWKPFVGRSYRCELMATPHTERGVWGAMCTHSHISSVCERRTPLTSFSVRRRNPFKVFSHLISPDIFTFNFEHLIWRVLLISSKVHSEALRRLMELLRCYCFIFAIYKNLPLNSINIWIMNLIFLPSQCVSTWFKLNQTQIARFDCSLLKSLKGIQPQY